MNKYIYNIGYHSYEESEYTQLSHSKKYTLRDIQKIMNKASIKAIKKMKKSDKHFYIHNFQDIYFEVIALLISDYGFEKLSFEVNWDCFGWASIFSEDDWEIARDKNLKELTKAIKNAGFSEKNDSFFKWTKKKAKRR